MNIFVATILVRIGAKNDQTNISDRKTFCLCSINNIFYLLLVQSTNEELNNRATHLEKI